MSEDVILDVHSAGEAIAAFDREIDTERRASMSAWALKGDPEAADVWREKFEAHVKEGRRSLAEFVIEMWPEDRKAVRAWLAEHERA